MAMDTIISSLQINGHSLSNELIEAGKGAPLKRLSMEGRKIFGKKKDEEEVSRKIATNSITNTIRISDLYEKTTCRSAPPTESAAFLSLQPKRASACQTLGTIIILNKSPLPPFTSLTHCYFLLCFSPQQQAMALVSESRSQLFKNFSLSRKISRAYATATACERKFSCHGKVLNNRSRVIISKHRKVIWNLKLHRERYFDTLSPNFIFSD
jgi:hypothetical protein